MPELQILQLFAPEFIISYPTNFYYLKNLHYIHIRFAQITKICFVNYNINGSEKVNRDYHHLQLKCKYLFEHCGFTQVII